MAMRRTTSRAYRAGQHVHNFFAVIGISVATVAVTAKNTVRDFAVGVKDGGESERKEEKAPSRARTA